VPGRRGGGGAVGAWHQGADEGGVRQAWGLAR
jgi:hypothetical protein